MRADLEAPLGTTNALGSVDSRDGLGRSWAMVQTEYSAKLDSTAFLTILAFCSHERSGKRNRSEPAGQALWAL